MPENTAAPVGAILEEGLRAAKAAATRQAVPTAVVVTAVGVEGDALRKHLVDTEEDTAPHGAIYERGTLRTAQGPWQIVLVQAQPGNPAAAFETAMAIHHCSPQVALLMGIAGGIKDVALGDVVVGTKIYAYESGRAGSHFQARPEPSCCSPRLLARAKYEANRRDWLNRLPGPVVGATPRVWPGPIAAGEKVVGSTSADVYKLLREHYSDALAVDMEDHGFLTAVRLIGGVDALVVRGISDLIEGKAEAEALGSQETAARNASAFCCHILEKVREYYARLTACEAPANGPRELVVDPRSEDAYPTIGAAINAASPGARIVVYPGRYPEALVMDKPLRITGKGDREGIVVEAVGHSAVSFLTEVGVITNLTLRQVGGNCCGVDISQGHLKLQDCDIRSSGPGVAIHGGADPYLLRNRIHDSGQEGVIISDGGEGTLEDNEISGSAGEGLRITTAGSLVLRRNRIRDGKGDGVCIGDGQQGLLEENDIFGNAAAGVVVRGGANPTLRHNGVHDNGRQGICVSDGGRGVFEDNDIFRNGDSGVEIAKGADPWLCRNHVRDGRRGGVHIHSEGRGRLEGNDVHGNMLSGVAIETGGDPMLRHNHIYHNGQDGVHACRRGRGRLEGNLIDGNGCSGIALQGGAELALHCDHVNDNSHFGIWVEYGSYTIRGCCTLERNEKGPLRPGPESNARVCVSEPECSATDVGIEAPAAFLPRPSSERHQQAA